MMTELGHGSNIKESGTMATYDHSSREFIIHTPNTAAQKYLVGNSYYSARQGVVFANLVMEGESKGIHSFVVPLRDENHNLLPGVRIKSVGLKANFVGTDNGRIWFDHYRVPREALLNRYADVTEDGQYTTSVQNANLRFAKHIGALLMARMAVGLSSIMICKLGMVVAIRYAFKRRQFGPKKGQEVPLMYYQIHRNKLMPRLARLYGQSYFMNYCKRRYAAMTEKDLKEVHLLISAAKSIISWDTNETLDVCRQLCGGQGYLVRNTITYLFSGNDALVTLDGANPVLFQQISQVLLANYAKYYKSKNAISKLFALGQEKTRDFMRNGMVVHLMNIDEQHLRSADFILGALAFRTNRLLHTLAARLMDNVKRHGAFDGYNNCQSHSANLSQAYCDQVIAESFHRTLQRMENELGADHEITRSNRVMFALFGLWRISCDSYFVEKRVISVKKSEAIRDEVDKLCQELVPASLSLVSAFGLPEHLFEHTIGSKTASLDSLNHYDNDVIY